MAKAPFYPASVASAKRSHRGSVSGGLHRGGKPGVFSLRLRDMAAGSGSFTGITRRIGRVFARMKAENAKKRDRIANIGRRGLPSTPDGKNDEKHPVTARFAPHCGPRTRQRAVHRTESRHNRRFTRHPDPGQTRRGVPGCLCHDRKTHDFPPHLRDKTVVVTQQPTQRFAIGRPRWLGALWYRVQGLAVLPQHNNTLNVSRASLGAPDG
jgi:hypothetical protein